jgi:hypothetical protein
MKPIGQHRDDYDDESDFHADILDASWTVGGLLARLGRCGLTPDDLAPHLPEHIHPRWWRDGRAGIPNPVAEMIFRIDGVRRELRDRLVAHHVHSRRPVVLHVHRTDAEARRWALENDAGRGLTTDANVPGFAAVQRVAAIDAADALVELGVFATVEFHNDPMVGGNQTAPEGRDPNWIPPEPEGDPDAFGGADRNFDDDGDGPSGEGGTRPRR